MKRVPEDVWRGLVHPDDASVFEYELQEALKAQRSMHALVRARRADGQWRWLEMNARPRFSRMGRFIGLAGSSPDVTERREIELARGAAAVRACRAQRCGEHGAAEGRVPGHAVA